LDKGYIILKENLKKIAKTYGNPDKFKKYNFPQWAIAKRKGWLREFFPNHIEPEKVLPLPEHTPLIETPLDAKLRHAIDDYIVNLRIIKNKKKGIIPKVYISKILKDLEEILNKY